ncbi:MAG: hypothetical protein K5986_06650 [Clostridium sp.]|nr:hypothetical protein [Clostridium sp.]
MKRFIILNKKKFPEAFNSISNLSTSEEDKIRFVEDEIIKSINEYNKKLMIDEIQYADINENFPKFKAGKFNGAVVEEFKVHNSTDISNIIGDRYYINIGLEIYCRRIIMYIFISPTSDSTRNALISQTVFPTLLDYAEEYIDSPSYNIANHKFCFLNVINKKITSQMILRHMASLYIAGIDYIEVFPNHTLETKEVPRNIKEFLKVYAPDYSEYYNEENDIYNGLNYYVDFNNKIFKWKTHDFIHKLKESANGVDFNGSAEKFYWIEMLPISIFAYRCGYKIDYSEYSKFISTYKSKFSKKSDKFKRCETLLSYIDKYFI